MVKITKLRPMFRECCQCQTIYGCYNGEVTRDCASCFHASECFFKVMLAKEPAKFPDTTSGFCTGCAANILKAANA